MYKKIGCVLIKETNLKVWEKELISIKDKIFIVTSQQKCHIGTKWEMNVVKTNACAQVCQNFGEKLTFGTIKKLGSVTW